MREEHQDQHVVSEVLLPKAHLAGNKFRPATDLFFDAMLDFFLSEEFDNDIAPNILVSSSVLMLKSSRVGSTRTRGARPI